jgi:hypothetical protein
MKTLLIVVLILGFCGVCSAGEIYSWTDKNGNTFYSDSPPPSGSFRKQKVEDYVDKTLETRKEIEKSTLPESEKLDEKIKNEVEFQKKAKKQRDYDAMRKELDDLQERCDKKWQDHKDKYRSVGYGTHGINRSDRWEKEAREIIDQCKKEAKRIKDLYGYY